MGMSFIGVVVIIPFTGTPFVGTLVGIVVLFVGTLSMCASFMGSSLGVKVDLIGVLGDLGVLML